MDLIYMNANKEDIGVMKDYTFDLAYGSDENDFECKIVQTNHCCEQDFYLYIEGTEYGGIIDNIGVDTEAEEVTYHGRTWHGILNSKILEPDSGADYLTVNGEANSVLATLIERMGLGTLFTASADTSGITISNYKMNRYIPGYDGICKMLKASGAKLIMSFVNGFVELSAKPIIDYSQDEQFDTDQIALTINRKGNPLNHVICLGKGDLKEREVIHVYADQNGNISENKVFTGIEEVTGVYDNSNAADSEELKQGGVDMIKAAWASDELDFDFIADEESYDIGDIVGAEEHITNTDVKREITKKIVTIANNTVTVSYPSDNSGGGNYQTVGGGGSGSAANFEFPIGFTFYWSPVEGDNTDLSTAQKVHDYYGYGIWEQVKDKFILAAGDTYTVGVTGGEATHILSVNEIPAHTHGSKSLVGQFPLWGEGSGMVASQTSGIASAVGDNNQYGWGTDTGRDQDNTSIKINATHEHTSVGGSQPHNNMPPYEVFYCWKRTA